MSVDAKMKPGLKPEQLVIEGDTGETLDRLPGTTHTVLRPEAWTNFDLTASYAPGLYEAIVATGTSLHPLQYELHHTRTLEWRIRGGAPKPYKNILRVRRLGELPELANPPVN